jgi:type II secretory pathway component PulJ
MRTILKRLGDERGFTLIELVIVMPMLTLVLGAITMTMVSLSHGDSKTTEQLAQQESFRPTLDAMVGDLRSAMPPTLGGAAVISATSTSIVFYSPDRAFATSGSISPFHLREVAYRFSGGALQRQSVTSTNTYAAVTATALWGSWTSSAGTFPLASFPTATGWTTLLGAGLAAGGASPALGSATLTYYDGEGNPITSPVTAANLGLIRSIEVDVTGTTGGQYGQQTTYSETATIRETQPPQ